MCDFTDYLKEAGISDSRHWSLRNALDSMHSAYCELDLNNRVKFDDTFGSGVREALIKYAERRPNLNTNLRSHIPQEQIIREMTPKNRIIDVDLYVQD